jgi:predicted nucleic acid-binding protein
VTSLVVDANVVLWALGVSGGLSLFRGQEVAAPPLLWPEARSALHVARWRGLIQEADAGKTLELLDSGAISERRHRRLGLEAWRIADQLGWAKTYDAEYLALALLLDAPLATFDRRMVRGAEHTGVRIEVLR